MIVNEAIQIALLRINKSNTIASYQATFVPFAQIFGERDISSVSPAEIRSYLEQMPVSSNTRKLRYTHLKVVFNVAADSLREARMPVSWENPCNPLNKAFQGRKTNPTPLADTIHADMETIRGSLRQKHRLIFDLGTRAGLRVSEIISIRPADMIKNGSWACLMLQAPKSGADQEPAWIPVELFDSLNEYVNKAGIGHDSRIFPLTRQAVYQVFKSRGVEPHDLRRYRAFTAVEDGKDLETVRALLRHANVNTTTRYIGRLSVAKLAEKMESAG